MTVNIFPNPAINTFNLTVSTLYKERIIARILNIQGTELERMIVEPNHVIKFGAELLPGIYIVEIRQGNNKIIQKLSKL